ncbi:MAG: hydrogenase expression/formation protein HypE [Bacillota bacterium]
MKTIQLAHGGGGKPSRDLLELITASLGACLEKPGEDSGSFSLAGRDLAMTTDSFIIKPLFFPGGDIGKLSICGTINDLVMAAAKPLYLTVSLILEEGFPLPDLQRILASLKKEAFGGGIKIIAGDTKVAPRGELDGIFINTAGLGVKVTDRMIGAGNARPGDKIIITGSMGDHGGVIMALRNGFSMGSTRSDCKSLLKLLDSVKNHEIHAMRDPTRGGTGSVLNEIAEASQVDLLVAEEALPVKNDIRGICDILGLDPLYLACEGRAVIFCPPLQSAELVEDLKKTEDFAESCEIGEVLARSELPKVYLRTRLGTRRILPPLIEELTPRIC